MSSSGISGSYGSSIPSFFVCLFVFKGITVLFSIVDVSGTIIWRLVNWYDTGPVIDKGNKERNSIWSESLAH